MPNYKFKISLWGSSANYRYPQASPPSPLQRVGTGVRPADDSFYIAHRVLFQVFVSSLCPIDNS